MGQAVGHVLNPSYLALDETGTYIFAASENFDKEGAVWVFRRQLDGRLVATGTRPSGGRATCHVCVTARGIVCASSYIDGSLSVFRFRNGTIGPRERLFHYQGKSVNAARQESSHAHQAGVSHDLHWLYVCDLGADRIWCHPITDGGIAPALPNSVATPAGSGPRHLVFHPTHPRIYVICELNAHLLTYDWSTVNGLLTLVDDQPSLPNDWNGEPAAAAIRVHPSGTALYVSNRNHDSLTAFNLDTNGRAELACCIPAGGKAPRDLAVDPTGRWLLAANQKSNNLTIHPLDSKNNLPTGRTPVIAAIATPTCILFAERNV